MTGKSACNDSHVAFSGLLVACCLLFALLDVFNSLSEHLSAGGAWTVEGQQSACVKFELFIEGVVRRASGLLVFRRSL